MSVTKPICVQREVAHKMRKRKFYERSPEERKKCAREGVERECNAR